MLPDPVVLCQRSFSVFMAHKSPPGQMSGCGAIVQRAGCASSGCAFKENNGSGSQALQLMGIVGCASPPCLQATGPIHALVLAMALLQAAGHTMSTLRHAALPKHGRKNSNAFKSNTWYMSATSGQVLRVGGHLLCWAFLGQCPSSFTSLLRAVSELLYWDGRSNFKGRSFVSKLWRQKVNGLSHNPKWCFTTFHATEHILLCTRI